MESSLFLDLIVSHQGLTTFLKPYLDDLDLLLLKFCCKTLNAKIPKVEPKRKSHFTTEAIKIGYFKIYCWIHNFDEIIYRFRSSYWFNTAYSKDDFEFQKRYINEMIQSYESLKNGIRYITTSNNDPAKYSFYTRLCLVHASLKNNSNLFIWIEETFGFLEKCDRDSYINDHNEIYENFKKHKNQKMLQWLENMMIKHIPNIFFIESE